MNFPGLIDLQINGYIGIDFSSPDLTEADAIRAFEAIVKSGARGFFPTIVTSPLALFERNLPILARAMSDRIWGKHALGIHVEGPFLCPLPGYIGAHKPEWALDPDPELLRQFQVWADGKIRILTMAAGQPGADELAKKAVSMGISVFLAHQKCETADLLEMVDHGAKAFTHLGNSIPHELGKHKNPLWSAFLIDGLSATVIPDGFHLSLELLRVIIKVKGPDRVAVISDASPFAGLPPGRYATPSNEISLEEDGKLWNPVKKFLAGSSFSMLRCMNYLAANVDLRPEDLLKTAFLNPLRLTGLNPESVPETDYRIDYDPAQRTFRLTEP